jgi:hypothetical protein
MFKMAVIKMSKPSRISKDLPKLASNLNKLILSLRITYNTKFRIYKSKSSRSLYLEFKTNRDSKSNTPDVRIRLSDHKQHPKTSKCFYDYDYTTFGDVKELNKMIKAIVKYEMDGVDDTVHHNKIQNELNLLGLEFSQRYKVFFEVSEFLGIKFKVGGKVVRLGVNCGYGTDVIVKDGYNITASRYDSTAKLMRYIKRLVHLNINKYGTADMRDAYFKWRQTEDRKRARLRYKKKRPLTIEH